MRTKDYLPHVAVMALVISIALPLCARYKYNNISGRAEARATKIIGDRVLPLTESERSE